MPVVQLPPEILRTGYPMPVSVRDAAGMLLVAKGAVLTSEEQRLRLVSRALFVDESEGELLKRVLNGKLDSMVRQNARLGHIAETKTLGADLPNGATPVREAADAATAWGSLQMRASALLRDPPPEDLIPRLHKLQQEVLELIDADADLALLVLVQATASDGHHYSVMHSLLVTVLVELAARQLPSFTPDWLESLRFAALTMNMAMTSLQDQLALQDALPNAQQRELISTHAQRGAACLRGAGVSDERWLQAVEFHHLTSAGPLAPQAPGRQLARLLQRADISSALLSVRKSRPAIAAADAMKAAYLDERQQADEAGTALIQSTGIYLPGSFVRLRSGEVALVLRRSAHARAPKVASVLSRSGVPLVEPTIRDTRLRPHDVVGSVAPHEVKVRLHLEKLLRLA